MVKVLMQLAYNGEPYCGFQRQTKPFAKPAIQNVVEETITRLYRRTAPPPILITAAGRTDAGVHADDQPIVFTLSENEANRIAIERIAPVLNRLLPPSITALKSMPVSHNFNPRYAAKARLYRYHFRFPLHAPPRENFYAATKPSSFASFPSSHVAHPQEKTYVLPQPICARFLTPFLLPFIGTHNFSAFCSAKDGAKHKIRTIYTIEAKESPGHLIVDIYGNAFLRGMVRSLLGNALHCYKKKHPPEKITSLMQAKNPRLAKARVPAQGLTLKKVFFQQIF